MAKRAWYVGLVVAFVSGWLSAVLLAGTPYGGDVARVIGPGSMAQLQTPWGLRMAFAPFWETWQLIDAVFFARDDINHQRMIDGAIRGMLDTLDDRYTFYQEPERAKQTSENMQGTTAGIGAYLRYEQNQVVIGELIADAPASQADLRVGDVIVRVDDVLVADVVATESDGAAILARVAGAIRGPVGTTVELDLLRDQELLTVQLTRAEIVLPSVEWQVLESNIGYIHITDFKANTPEFVREAITELSDADVRGIVIDLRGNPGGLLDSARQVLGLFYEGVALWEQNAAGALRQLDTVVPADYEFPQVPLVVLIDENSASASEVVAGALRDQVPGTQLLGTTSFGKGIVQNIYPLSNGGTTRLTVAQWLTPKQTQIHAVGLVPDVVLTTSDTAPADMPCVADRQPLPDEPLCRDEVLGYALQMWR